MKKHLLVLGALLCLLVSCDKEADTINDTVNDTIATQTQELIAPISTSIPDYVPKEEKFWTWDELKEMGDEVYNWHWEQNKLLNGDNIHKRATYYNSAIYFDFDVCQSGDDWDLNIKKISGWSEVVNNFSQCGFYGWNYQNWGGQHYGDYHKYRMDLDPVVPNYYEFLYYTVGDSGAGWTDIDGRSYTSVSGNVLWIDMWHDTKSNNYYNYRNGFYPDDDAIYIH